MILLVKCYYNGDVDRLQEEHQQSVLEVKKFNNVH